MYFLWRFSTGPGPLKASRCTAPQSNQRGSPLWRQPSGINRKQTAMPEGTIHSKRCERQSKRGSGRKSGLRLMDSNSESKSLG